MRIQHLCNNLLCIRCTTIAELKTVQCNTIARFILETGQENGYIANNVVT